MSSRRARGFTLLEMLVVVGIILILIAMGMSSYRNSRQRSYEVAGFHGMKVLSAAQEAYHTSNGRYAQTFRELQDYSIIARAYRQSDVTGPAGNLDSFMRGFSLQFISNGPNRFSIIAVGHDYPHNRNTGDRVIFRLTQEGLVEETRAGVSGLGGPYAPAH